MIIGAIFFALLFGLIGFCIGRWTKAPPPTALELFATMQLQAVKLQEENMLVEADQLRQSADNLLKVIQAKELNR